ncbi:MAG: threonine--tRNA ligase, partial [Oscillospiraceae bacterium]|nr:threonine--tRNA ligase [Oscillospiraceae bacterium]
MKITLKDGSVREAENGIQASEIVKGIGAGLYKAACCVKINGKVCDLRTAVNGDCNFEVVTFENADTVSEESAGRKTYWHTCAHILAQAVKRLFPDVKLAIGPAIADGFYYDFDIEKPFSQEDLNAIESEMKKIVKADYPIEQFTLPYDEALKLLENEPYKIELCQEHRGEPLSFYRQGADSEESANLTDLCAGPHLMSTGQVKSFKLLSCTGAYWRGSEKNKMLSRIYGIAFPKKADLDSHIERLEQAKLRDHNKLGRELEFFTTVDTIGQGLPVLLPKGAKVIQILQRFVEDTEEKHGYRLTKTPLMAKSDLYKISGHWDHYRDGMFVLGNEEKDEELYALRPMTCPFQYQVFLNRGRSYRDLPMRLNETSTLFRNEDSGEMHGLIRVRQFTISEAHQICTPEQLEDEFKLALELANYMLTSIGLIEDVSYRFSTWDGNDREKYIGTAQQWAEAESVMKNILDRLGLNYSTGIGEAAFYGPKLDIQIKNVHGKEDTLIT